MGCLSHVVVNFNYFIVVTLQQSRCLSFQTRASWVIHVVALGTELRRLNWCSSPSAFVKRFFELLIVESLLFFMDWDASLLFLWAALLSFEGIVPSSRFLLVALNIRSWVQASQERFTLLLKSVEGLILLVVIVKIWTDILCLTHKLACFDFDLLSWTACKKFWSDFLSLSILIGEEVLVCDDLLDLTLELSGSLPLGAFVVVCMVRYINLQVT